MKYGIIQVMQTMIDYNFGDIVLVPFPFTDQLTSKKRPGIVVSSDSYNCERPDLVIMAATSQVKALSPFGEITITKWKRAGLLKPSVIKPIFTTIEKKLILKKLGRLEEKDRQHLQENLSMLLGE